jgi:2'-5' RNA ligase
MPHDHGDTAAGASIWLLPAASDADVLRSIILELSARFGTPAFEPHLTLLGDLPASWGSYVPLLDDLAKACVSFSQPAEGIVLTDAYFRSFYAAFARSSELDALKRLCVTKAGGTAEGFTPHVSLLYGQVAAHEKAEAAKDVEQRLRGKRIAFDRVVVTNSSDNVPINEWRVHAIRRLGFPGRER